MENIRYAVSYEAEPEVYQTAFAMWGAKYDVGYDWFEFDELIPGISVFDDANQAIGFARDVLPEVSANILYIIAVNEDEEVSCIAQIV